MRTLGFARIYRTDDGELVMDQDSLRRTDFSGEGTGFDGYVEFGADYDDFEGEDDYDDDDDDDDSESDDFEGDEDDEFGDAAARRSRRAKRKRSSAGRKMKRAKRKLSRADELEAKNKGGKSRGEGNMQATVVSDYVTGDAGSVSITITLNHSFNAEDVTFDGSSSGAKVHSIIFGDDLVWSSPKGTPVTVFSANSQLRDVLKGRRARGSAGTSIVVNGSIAADNDTLYVNFVGSKPASRC